MKRIHKFLNCIILIIVVANMKKSEIFDHIGLLHSKLTLKYSLKMYSKKIYFVVNKIEWLEYDGTLHGDQEKELEKSAFSICNLGVRVK